MKLFTKNLNQVDLTYKLKHVFCHDPGCWTCAQGKGHGPYWHVSYEEEGQTHTVFLGKDFNPIDLESDTVEETSTRQKTAPRADKKSSSNSAENRFNFESIIRPNTAHNINKTMATDNRTTENFRNISPPPTRFDFERDLKTLKNTIRADNLKTVYRKLTKKYHPDKYPGIGHINTWMAEINGQYSQMKKSIRC